MGVDRIDPPHVSDERTSLEAWLEYHRATLLQKCEGLTPDELRQCSVPPSDLSLWGLVRHMAEVEKNWFRHVLDREPWATEPKSGIWWSMLPGGDPDGDLHVAPDDDWDADLAVFHEQVERARAIAAEHDLDDTGVRRDEPVDLRWIYTHMIEEYARHNGHADLLRQAIDGATGD